MDKKGMLVVLSAPSGCGKDTVFKALNKLRHDVVESISATTRSPRDGEIDGVDYYFKTREEFEQMIKENGLFEYAQYNGNYYGTPVAGVKNAINEGKICFLIIEVQGAKEIMMQHSDCVSIFLYPPSFEILESRLRGRMSEPDDIIKNRLDIAREEIKSAPNYKYQVLNDVLDDAVSKINTIIENELKERNMA